MGDKLAASDKALDLLGEIDTQILFSRRRAGEGGLHHRRKRYAW